MAKPPHTRAEMRYCTRFQVVGMSRRLEGHDLPNWHVPFSTLPGDKSYISTAYCPTDKGAMQDDAYMSSIPRRLRKIGASRHACLVPKPRKRKRPTVTNGVSL